MNKHICILVAAAAAMLANPAAAYDAVTTGNVNMRDGPGAFHSRISTVPAGAHVFVHACTVSNSWCNVGYGHSRGWVSGRFVRPVGGSAHPVQHHAPHIVVGQPPVHAHHPHVHVHHPHVVVQPPIVHLHQPPVVVQQRTVYVRRSQPYRIVTSTWGYYGYAPAYSYAPAYGHGGYVVYR